jgi:hypothetical protein
LEESYLLSAPGAAERVAELSDVEPKEMPFHISAQAKLFDLQPDPVRAWHLNRWRIDWMGAAGLGALRQVAGRLDGEAPEAGAANAHYAVVLRSGWGKDALAAAAACSNSPMGHIQRDNGALLIGAGGRWLITDPGYQQYMRDAERDFTVGPAAHNHPVINGLAQDKKEPRLLVLEKASDQVLRAALDLTSCYPAQARVDSAVRHIWLSAATLAVAADQLKARDLQSLAYHWHGDPDAAWRCQDGWALLHTRDADLWFTSPQVRISDELITRLPGARGQLTLAVEMNNAPPVVWWVFLLAEQPVACELCEEGRAIRVLGQRFSV